jgi:hypothetical protein
LSTRHTSAQSRQTERREARYSLSQRVLNGLQMTRLSRRRMIRLLPHPVPTISEIDRRHTGRMRKRDILLTEKGGGGGGGAQSCDGEKAWSSINHSILSGLNHKIKTKKNGGHNRLCTKRFIRLFVATHDFCMATKSFMKSEENPTNGFRSKSSNFV